MIWDFQQHFRFVKWKDVLDSALRIMGIAGAAYYLGKDPLPIWAVLLTVVAVFGMLTDLSLKSESRRNGGQP